MSNVKFPASLLSIDTNAKTVKGQKYGFMTGILYLAPSDISGFQTCPMAETAGCREACLYSAGRGAFNSVQQSRINKTKLFFSHRQEFMLKLASDIQKLVNKAKRAGMIPLVRLNGTSDIRFESIRFEYPFANGKTREVTIFELFPDVQFYDYTKLSNRRDIPANYDLTFSYSGLPGYQSHVSRAKLAGMRIAVVFRKREDIPAQFMGMECVDGDNSDIRHMDAHGVVVALYAKGNAKRDMSGFVVDTQRKVIPLKIAA